jgi:hypothetical protein
MKAAFRALQPFARAARREDTTPAQCELCATSLGESHAHVLELASRKLLCACAACAILFRGAGAGNGRYRTLPTRVIVDEKFAPNSGDWAALGIPVRLAYLVRRGTSWSAFLPSPGGAVEASLPEVTSEVLARVTPLAAEIEENVEALLLERRNLDAQCFLVPLNVGLELTAVVRRSWRGFQGGEEADRALRHFFDRLRGRAGRRSERSER